jgi:hypothetical protein
MTVIAAMREAAAAVRAGSPFLADVAIFIVKQGVDER